MDGPQSRFLNVSLLPGSQAHLAYYARATSGLPGRARPASPRSAPPHSSLQLHFFGGKTIADLVYVNRYLGGPGAWDPADRASIDAALAKAMSDNALQSVLQQYYEPAISSRMLPSAVLPGRVPATVYKNQVEALAARIYRSGALGDADPGRTLVNIMLPRGVVLVDGFSPGFQPAAGTEAEHERRLRAVVTVGAEAADSRHGLGGYHGSTNVAGAAVYYAVGVYSEGGNGVPVFDQPWKNVAATFYHELNEARTDPDVEDAIRTGDSSRLGWYSAAGGEVGDIPVREAGTRLALIFTEIELADGSGAVPVQLMWSNQDEGPARRIELASPSLPCGVAQPPGDPNHGPPGRWPRRSVNARWFAAWTTGYHLSPVRSRPAGPAKGPFRISRSHHPEAQRAQPDRGPRHRHQHRRGHRQRGTGRRRHPPGGVHHGGGGPGARPVRRCGGHCRDQGLRRYPGDELGPSPGGGPDDGHLTLLTKRIGEVHAWLAERL